MLERLTGCFESSCRHVHSQSKEAISCRRTLHALLHNYRFKELDIPRLRINVVEQQATLLPRRPRRSRHNGEECSARVAWHHGEILDFLYPPKALAYLNRRSIYATGCFSPLLASKRRFAGIRGMASAQAAQIDSAQTIAEYSSAETIPEKSSIGESFVQLAREPCTAVEELGFRRKSSAPTLEKRLTETIPNSDNAEAFEELWQLYLQLDEVERQMDLMIFPLAAYLSFSTRNESKRIQQLLGSGQNRQHYQPFEAEVLLHLAAGCVHEAINVFENAIRAGCAIGLVFPVLLARTINGHHWDLVSALVGAFLAGPQKLSNTNVWAYVKRLHDPLGVVRSFMKSRLDALPCTSSSLTAEGRFLLTGLTDSFSARLVSSAPHMVDRLLKEASKLGHKNLDVYHRVMQELTKNVLAASVSAAGRKLLFDMYKDYRETRGAAPSESLLGGLLSILARTNCKRGQLEIDPELLLDDYIRVHGKISGHATAALMKIYAREKSMEEVQVIFDRLPKDAKSILGMIRPLMHLYAQRGEVSKAKEQFERIWTEFRIRPDTSCWNVLLTAYVRAGLHDEALNCFDSMMRSGNRPDSYTFSPLLNMFAMGGETDGVITYLEIARTAGVSADTHMLGSLVLAHTKSGNFDAAEEAARLILDARNQDRLQGSITKPWNYLLSAFALRRRLPDVARIFKFMLSNGITPDSRTYGALILAMSLTHQANAGLKLLRVIMPKRGIEILPFHYAFVMLGFIKTQQLSVVVELYQEMQQRGLRPDAACRMQYLRAISLRNSHGKRRSSAGDIISRILDDFDKVAEPGSVRKFSLGVDGVGPADPVDAYFETLILSFGTNGIRDMMDDLTKEYVGRRKSEQGVDAMPVRLLAALMTGLLHDGEHDEIDICWKKCVQQTSKLLQHSSHGNELAAPSVLSAHRPLPLSNEQRLLLSRPLVPYLQSLAQRSQHNVAQSTVSSLLSQGFILDNIAWNCYVQTLASSNDASHILSAFQICEEKLMPNFPGWADRAWVQTRRQMRSRWEGGFNYMKDVAIGRGAAGERYLTKLIPQFETMRTLLDCFLKLRNAEKAKSSTGAEDIDLTLLDADGRELTLTSDGLSEITPSTIHALLTMPPIEVPIGLTARDERLPYVHDEANRSIQRQYDHEIRRQSGKQSDSKAPHSGSEIISSTTNDTQETRWEPVT